MTFLLCWAKTLRLEKGSLPGDRTNISGVEQFESGKIFVRSNVGGQMNYSPSCLLTNYCTPGTILSGRIVLSTSNLSMSSQNLSLSGSF
jgi:hypothetical protein